MWESIEVFVGEKDEKSDHTTPVSSHRAIAGSGRELWEARDDGKGQKLKA